MSQTKAQLISDLVQALNFTGTASAPANGAFLSAANTLALATNSAQRLTIDSSGRVGIGTDNPVAQLDAANNLVIGSTSDADSGMTLVSTTSGQSLIHFSDATSGNARYDGFFGYEQTGRFFKFGTAQAERMRLNSSGSLLIGGTSSVGDNYPLQVYHATDARMYLANTTAASSQDVNLQFAPANSVTGASITCTSEEDFSTSANRTARLTFQTRKDGTLAERMRIDSSGNVGIGTTSPARSLDVNGSLRLSNDQVVEWGGTSAAIYGSSSSNGLFFKTNSAERMRIDSSGNLLIGTTTLEDTTGNSGPKIINTGDITIDGNRKALVFRSTASSAHQMSGIQWWNENGAGVQCAIHGIRESILGAPGALAFYTNNDVDTTANNSEGDITEAMRIDSNQRILLGTTVSEDTTGNSGTKVISGGDITIDGDQKALVFRSTGSTAQIQSGIQWWNENGAGVMAKIHCIRSAIQKAPGDLAFFTNTDVDTTANNSEGDITERMRLRSNGDITFNGCTTTINSSNYGLYFLNDSSTTKSILIQHSREANGTHSTAEFYGNQGQFRIMGDGDAQNTNNNYGSISDETLKQDIVDASSQWDDIKAVKVRKFRFKSNPTGDLHIGVVAQELETVSPKLVKEVATSSNDLTSTETVKSVKYSVLYMKAIKALQEAQTRIETLETKVAALEAA